MDNKPSTNTPDSPAQHMLRKLDRRDKTIRAVELFTLFMLMVFNTFIAVKSVQTQQTIQRNQAVNIERIQGRNADLQQYLTCVLTLPISQRNDKSLMDCENTSTAFPPAKK